MRIELDFISVLAEWPMLVKGVAWTIGLTSISTVVGLALGIALAWSRVHGKLALRAFAGSYVETIRNTPFIVQLFFVYFGLPALGLRLSPEMASVIAMVINLSAYATEIIRAGIEATPKGQIEAGMSLALQPHQIFTHVVLPPALKKSVARAGKSNHHCDVGLFSLRPNFYGRIESCCQPDSESKLQSL